MSRRDASKAETRELILHAARSLFWEKGVDLCTMRSIAQEAGVSPASIIVHFKNKTSLLEVALYEDIEKAVAEAVASLPAEADLHSRLMHIPKTMFSFYDGNRDLYRALIRNTVFEPEKDNPHISAQLQQYIQFLAGMIEQEKFQDNIRQDVDAVIAAATIASLYMGVLITFYRNPEITPQMALENLAAMQRQHLTGIMTERGKDGLNP